MMNCGYCNWDASEMLDASEIGILGNIHGGNQFNNVRKFQKA